MLTITRTDPPIKYPNKFKAGDKARSLFYVKFIDGTVHRKGDVVEVKPGCESYYNVMHNNYEKIG